MKVIIIGDIHGRDHWKSIISNIDLVDHIVFLGDYCDSYTLPYAVVLSNLADIIQFKKDNFDKVTLLLGNHDLQYYFLDDSKIKCSGFKKNYSTKFRKLLRGNSNLFKLSHSIDIDNTTYVFSHAGINSSWLKDIYSILSDFKNKGNFSKMSILDVLLLPDYKYYLWDISYFRHGYSEFGSLVWSDIREYRDETFSLMKYKTLFDFPDNNEIIQIVGHNRVTFPTTINNKIYFFDTQDYSVVFGIISDNQIKVLDPNSPTLQEVKFEQH